MAVEAPAPADAPPPPSHPRRAEPIQAESVAAPAPPAEPIQAESVAVEAPAPPAEPIQAESVAVEAPADGPQEVHQADAVAQWTVVPQAPAPAGPAPSYLKDLLKAIQSQSVSGNPALSSLA